jgi:hypothetical protein
VEITAGAYNEGVSPQRRSKLEPHRIYSHSMFGTVAMNYIWLPIAAHCLPDALMDGINFSS